MNKVKVFGSNSLGKHGGGAARDAYQNHGARYGQGFGRQGNSFAIPTCDKPTGEPFCEISEDTLRYYIYCFILYAKMNPQDEFIVTQIGCGLAGWDAAVVAPMFKESPDNCLFDSAWESLLPNRRYWGTYGALAPAHPRVQPTAVTIDAQTFLTAGD